MSPWTDPASKYPSFSAGISFVTFIIVFVATMVLTGH